MWQLGYIEEEKGVKYDDSYYLDKQEDDDDELLRKILEDH